jgi:septum formation protein
MKLILASTSPYRKQLLERLHYPFECQRPQVDEQAVQQVITDPRALAQELARRKAQAVAQREPQALVIGGDQVASFHDRILGKPLTDSRAIEQLMEMQGKSHRLYTALHMQGPGIKEDILEVVELKMRPLTGAQVEAYVKLDQPLDCAGAYKIEAAGIKLFEKISTNDFNAIVGLPLIELQSRLVRQGFRLFDQLS